MEISRHLSCCECGSHGKKRGAKQEDQQVGEQDREHEDDRRAHGGGRTRRCKSEAWGIQALSRFIPTSSGCAPSPSPAIDRCETLIPLCYAPSSLQRTPHQFCLTYRSCRTLPPPLFTPIRKKTLSDYPLLTTGPSCFNVEKEVHVNISGFQRAPPPQPKHAFWTIFLDWKPAFFPISYPCHVVSQLTQLSPMWTHYNPRPHKTTAICESDSQQRAESFLFPLCSSQSS